MSLDLTTPTPLREAVNLLSGKTPIGSVLRTKEWSGMPLALRNTAQFSAGVESARVLERIQSGLLEAIRNERSEAKGQRLELGLPGTYKMDRQKFVVSIRNLAIEEGLIPAEDALEGTLQDITSEARLDLIFRTQMAQARGYAFWKRGQNETILNAWPAQELVRVAPRVVPRDWESRWQEAGGLLAVGANGGGRMVALKEDEIWVRLSRFGVPWPPFDFNSGMGLRELDREEAISLGLLSGDEVLQSQEVNFDENLQASVSNLSDGFKGALKTLFGRQIEVSGDVARWVPEAERKAA